MIDTDERRTKVVSTVRGLQQRDKTMVLLRSARSIVLGHNADNNEIVYSIISMLSTDQCKRYIGRISELHFEAHQHIKHFHLHRLKIIKLYKTLPRYYSIYILAGREFGHRVEHVRTFPNRNLPSHPLQQQQHRTHGLPRVF